MDPWTNGRQIWLRCQLRALVGKHKPESGARSEGRVGDRCIRHRPDLPSSITPSHQAPSRCEWCQECYGSLCALLHEPGAEGLLQTSPGAVGGGGMYPRR